MKNYRLYLVRHGITQGNLDGIYTGSGTDEPLCAQGVQQVGVGMVQGVPQLGQGDLGEVSVTAGIAGEVFQDGGDDRGVGRGVGHGLGADALGGDQAPDQGGPPGEQDVRAATALGGRQSADPPPERAHVQGVDPPR